MRGLFVFGPRYGGELRNDAERFEQRDARVANALVALRPLVGCAVGSRYTWSAVRGPSVTDVLDAIARSGLWARVEYPDGREPHFVGEPVPVSLLMAET